MSQFVVDQFPYWYPVWIIFSQGQRKCTMSSFMIIQHGSCVEILVYWLATSSTVVVSSMCGQVAVVTCKWYTLCDIHSRPSSLSQHTLPCIFWFSFLVFFFFPVYFLETFQRHLYYYSISPVFCIGIIFTDCPLYLDNLELSWKKDTY